MRFSLIVLLLLLQVGSARGARRVGAAFGAELSSRANGTQMTGMATNAPAPPISFTISFAKLPSRSAELAWDPSPDTSVVGYNVYYGVASRTYTNVVTVGSVTNMSVHGLVEGTTYYFAVTAYNILGVESDYSAEVSYQVPVSACSLLDSTVISVPLTEWTAVVTNFTSPFTINISPSGALYFRLKGLTNALAILIR